MRMTIFLIVLTCLGVRPGAAPPQTDGGRPTTIYLLYELYSWPGSENGQWNFCVLYNTSREKSVKEVFSKKTVLYGLDQLERKISDMPPGSKIIWRDELIMNGHKQKGSERLKYPPEQIVQEITRYARSRNIEMLGPFEHIAP
jgi:hypothetical protein